MNKHSNLKMYSRMQDTSLVCEL